MAMIVIEDGSESNSGTTKHVYSDLNDMSLETLAKAILRVSNMLESASNLADVQNDFDEAGGPVFTDDETAATWHDGIQTGSHFTFILV